MIALARTDPRTRQTYYLAESADGDGFICADHPINAALWETMGDLIRWVDSLTDDQVALLDRRHVRAVEVNINF